MERPSRHRLADLPHAGLRGAAPLLKPREDLALVEQSAVAHQLPTREAEVVDAILESLAAVDDAAINQVGDPKVGW